MANKLRRQALARYEQEKEQRFRAAIHQSRQSKKLFKSPLKVLEAIYNRSVSSNVLPPNSGYEALHKIFRNVSRKNKDAVYHYFRTIADLGGSRLLTSMLHVEALYNIYSERYHFIRPLEEWRASKSRNLDKFIGTLTRHLFVRYEMPNFMDKAWINSNDLHIGWYLLIGSGQSLRNAGGLPFPISKKSAHYFMQAPTSLTITQALRWAQVRSLGGDNNLALNLATTVMSEFFQEDNFWISVIRFLVANQDKLAIHQVNPIIDFLYSKRFLRRRGRERNEVLDPELPKLTMKRRTLPTLLAAVEQWHTDMARTPELFQYLEDNQRVVDIQAQDAQEYWETNKDWWKKYSKKWPSFGIRQFEYFEGVGQGRKIYTIRHLKSAKALADEGRTMRHCVGSYAFRCEEGRCAIFTLKLKPKGGSLENLVTIEVTKDKCVVQARSIKNAIPSSVSKRVIKLWAAENGLTIKNYAM